MGNPIFGGCPYQAEDGFNDRNRFPHGHLFVGEIENGKRYPFGVYTKEEADERFAVKGTEADLEELEQTVNASLDDLTDLVNSKASEAEAEAIRERLDALEYVDIKINSFSAVTSTFELGSVANVVLNWALNKEATAQNINGIPVTGNSKTFSAVNVTTVYTLSVTDGQTTASRSVTATFANRIYFGSASDLTDVTALNSVLSNTKGREFTTQAGEDEYIIYAVPVRLGSCSFFVGGFEGGFDEPEQMTLLNGSGFAEPYYVYKSTNPNLGQTTVEVR